MTAASIYTTNGDNWLLNRSYKAVTDYDEPFYMMFGIGQTTPTKADTSIEIPIPISVGTVNDDGSNTLTGSSGGDNSTDNIVIFKQGANLTDVTAQNLIGNDTSVSKVWTIADLSSAGTVVSSTDYESLWFYVLDAAALAKFALTGTALSIKFRTSGDGSTLYYEMAYETGDLVVGWNWIKSWPTIVSGLTQGAGGAPSGTIDEFVITVTTNNAADEFTAATDATAELVYDLLRGYVATDLVQEFESDYPSFNTTLKTVKVRCKIAVTECNGFDIGEMGVLTKDVVPILLTHDVFTPESKDSDSEFRMNNTDGVQ